VDHFTPHLHAYLWAMRVSVRQGLGNDIGIDDWQPSSEMLVG